MPCSGETLQPDDRWAFWTGAKKKLSEPEPPSPDFSDVQVEDLLFSGTGPSGRHAVRASARQNEAAAACGGTAAASCRPGGQAVGERGRYPAGPLGALLLTLTRLQARAFWRAPYLGARLALAVVKGGGALYAMSAAAILGFVMPDLLGVVAPAVTAVPLIEAALLPALGTLTVGRLLFQDVPTRGATAFLLLPVARERVAGSVLLRSALSPLNLVPLLFVAPFAARAVRAEAGAGGAWAFALGVVALVALSHGLLVVWKTRLGAAPGWTVGLFAGTIVAIVGLEVATDGVIRHVREGGGVVLAVLGVLAALVLTDAFRALVAALYLDGGGDRRATTSGAVNGFERGGVRAFVDLDLRLVTRTTFPRGIVVNAVLVSVALTVGALLVERLGWGEGVVVGDLILVFSTGPIAGSFGQFAVPFASGFYDRLLTLPGAVWDFAQGRYAVIAAGTLGLGALHLGVVASLAPEAAWLIGVSVLFSLGVLTPAALWGSTLGPKPLDVSERMMFNYKAQSFGAQVMVGTTGAVAGAAMLSAGTESGALVAGVMGVVGVLATPLWLRGFARRVERRRHAVAARFRGAL